MPQPRRKHQRLIHRGGRFGEEILDAVWPGIHVTEDSVTQCVGEIRRAIVMGAGEAANVFEGHWAAERKATPAGAQPSLPRALWRAFRGQLSAKSVG